LAVISFAIVREGDWRRVGVSSGQAIAGGGDDGPRRLGDCSSRPGKSARQTGQPNRASKSGQQIEQANGAGKRGRLVLKWTALFGHFLSKSCPESQNPTIVSNNISSTIFFAENWPILKNWFVCPASFPPSLALRLAWLKLTAFL
jgi:hypothetical protein